MEHSFNIEQLARDEIRTPNAKYAQGQYQIRTDSEGSIQVFGDRQGLLYIAEVIATCAVGDLSSGFHVHIPCNGVAAGPTDMGEKELTVYSASTRPPTER